MMFRTIAATVAALSISASAAAAATPLATFYSVGDDPIIQFDYSPQYGFDIDTITPSGQVNTMFSWHRSDDWLHPAYDYLDAFVALGELAAILTITGQPINTPAGQYQALANYSIVYAGPDVVANGVTFSAGDRLLYGTMLFGQPHSYARSDFFYNGPSIDFFDLGLVNPVTNGDIVTAGLSAKFWASVPEPSTWAMLIIGFGLAGATLRANRQRPEVKPA